MCVRAIIFNYQQMWLHHKISKYNLLFLVFIVFAMVALTNVMHYFKHGPTNIVTPMFLWTIIHWKNYNKPFMLSYSSMGFVATLLWGKCDDETHTPKIGGLPKFQSLIARVKTPHIGVFFTSLESYWSVNV
jgi:hypothetical protein